jgi:hypothetical protein
MTNLWTGIQPGDIGFDAGVGISGFVIRIGTQSQYGHCWIYHSLIGKDNKGQQIWSTVEAGPKEGLIYRERTIAPNKVVRLWSSRREQQAILEASASMVGLKYGWGEIVRICLRIVGIKIRGWESANRAICSNHVATSMLSARPELLKFMKYKPSEIWPGELALNLDKIKWHSDLEKETKRRPL